MLETIREYAPSGSPRAARRPAAAAARRTFLDLAEAAYRGPERRDTRLLARSTAETTTCGRRSNGPAIWSRARCCCASPYRSPDYWGIRGFYQELDTWLPLALERRGVVAGRAADGGLLRGGCIRAAATKGSRPLGRLGRGVARPRRAGGGQGAGAEGDELGSAERDGTGRARRGRESNSSRSLESAQATRLSRPGRLFASVEYRRGRLAIGRHPGEPRPRGRGPSSSSTMTGGRRRRACVARELRVERPRPSGSSAGDGWFFRDALEIFGRLGGMRGIAVNAVARCVRDR